MKRAIDPKEDRQLELADKFWEFARKVNGWEVADNMAECIVEGDMPKDRLTIAVNYAQRFIWDPPLSDAYKKELEELFLAAEQALI